MVVLRLKRFGRRHRPFYRICAMDRRSPRNGRVIEELGWFDPIAGEDRQLEVNVARVDHWLSVGAQPSRTVATLLRRVDCEPKPGKKVEATPPAPATTAPAPAPAPAPATPASD